MGQAKTCIYYWNEQAGRAVLVCNLGDSIDELRAQTLLENGKNQLYVRSSDYEALCAELLNTLDSIAADETLSPADRFEVIQTAVGLELERAFHRVDSDRFVELGEHIGSQIYKLVAENQVLPAKLFEIARHDYFTFTHVTNVTGYAVVLAQRLGITADEELNHIAIGAMLHDVGKRCIPSCILAKPTSLTPEERSAIRQHPQAGYQDLLNSALCNYGQRMMAYQHHERIDGTGYPVCVLGQEIHDWAKLLSVVDVFDALTGTRPYRKPLSFTAALDFIAARAGTQFDSEIVKCWIAAIKQQ